MTSKNSFLANIRENSKRRLWVWMLSMLFFMLAVPVIISIAVSQQANSLEYLIESYGEELARQALHERMINSMCGQMGFSPVLLVFTTIIAVAGAIQGFSYLYNRKKIDFYMGMPVKRKKRFLIIWLNGIVLYVVPYLLGLFISLLIAAGNGAVDKRVLLSASAAFGVNVIYFLCVYHLAILALMLTGNLVITGLGFLVFCFYEYAVRYMLYSYQSKFFKYFSYYNVEVAPAVSPFRWYAVIMDTFNYKDVVDLKYLFCLVVFAAVIGILSYVCYLKRPAEAAGRAMTFSVTKPIIKIMLTIPVALLSGQIIADAVDYSPGVSVSGAGYVLFTIALVVVIGSGLIQSIYEFDIKGMVHKKSHIVVSGVITAMIFLIFRYDLFGYDTYIPKPSQIESVAFIPSYYEENYGSGARFDEKGNYMSEDDYAREYMYLSDTEDICELVSLSMQNYNQLSDAYLNSEDFEETGLWSAATMIYRLKSGREVYRRIMVNVEDEQTAALLDNIMGSDEFKKGYLPGASENLVKLLEGSGKYKIKAGYGNTVYWEELSQAEIKELLEIYQRDLRYADFSNVKKNLPVGLVRLTISEEVPGSGYFAASEYMRSTRSWYAGMNIYPFYKETIAWLKEHGYYKEFQLNTEDVEHIQIVNNNTAAYNALVEKQSLTAGADSIRDAQAVVDDYGYYSTLDYDSDTVDTRVYVDYTDMDSIKQIASAVYPQEMVNSDWDYGVTGENDYIVYVYFKTDSPMTRKYGSSVSYVFPEGQVPDFVQNDTLYKK